MTTIRSRVLHVESTNPLRWQYFEDGVIQVSDGRIAAIGAADQVAKEGMDLSTCDHRPGQLIVPGFIDTHVHSPQIDVIASYGEQLLDWLDRYTFPAETRYADEAYAEKSAQEFLDGLIAAGTTTAMVYVTSHKSATDLFFAAASQRSMRMIAGKVMMDQNAPARLMDTAESSERDTRELISQWHGHGRLGYAVTPRFAVSSSSDQLARAGQIHRDVPDTWVQTHLAENHREIEWVRELHPDSRDYLDVYDKHGLLTDRTVFGHCLHLSDQELSRLSQAGGKVAFCPSSNMFIGSGLLNLDRMRNAAIDVSVASDVGGGASLSMFRTMADAYKVCQLQGQLLSPMESFAMITLGNAETLGLDRYIGNLAVGKEADFLILDPGEEGVLARRVGLAKSIEEEIFVYLTMADEGVVAETWINGVPV